MKIEVDWKYKPPTVEQAPDGTVLLATTVTGGVSDFLAEDIRNAWHLVIAWDYYVTAEPAKPPQPKYVPFETVEEARQLVGKVLQTKEEQVDGVSAPPIIAVVAAVWQSTRDLLLFSIADSRYTVKDLFENWVHLDGSPVGKVVQ